MSLSRTTTTTTTMILTPSPVTTFLLISILINYLLAVWADALEREIKEYDERNKQEKHE
jgi:hypothetical protein